MYSNSTPVFGLTSPSINSLVTGSNFSSSTNLPYSSTLNRMCFASSTQSSLTILFVTLPELSATLSYTILTQQSSKTSSCLIIALNNSEPVMSLLPFVGLRNNLSTSLRCSGSPLPIAWYSHPLATDCEAIRVITVLR